MRPAEFDHTPQVSYDLCLYYAAQQRIAKCVILKQKLARKDPLETMGAQRCQFQTRGSLLKDVGRTRDIVGEEKENDEDVLSTKDVLSTDKEKVSTDRPIVSTDGSKVSTDRLGGFDDYVSIQMMKISFGKISLAGGLGYLVGESEDLEIRFVIHMLRAGEISEKYPVEKRKFVLQMLE
ncbi:hypothetical protein Tco_0705436 [Tanacetum coccineum]|uniref:Uncharacterized protein n=1 Tax=Tanacetum coccineum TaxID=301880 RepID=A0ABQ4Y6I7_9ASTR